jgi:TRAP-type C4-dicarboxylate transport system permease small subunit
VPLRRHQWEPGNLVANVQALTGTGTERTSQRPRPNAVLRVFDLIVDGAAALAAALLIAVMLTTTIKVGFRYGLGEGLFGIDQISGTMLLYITFLGAAWVLRREEHVTIDLLVGVLDTRNRRRLHILGSILGAAICLSLALFGTLEVLNSLQKGIRIPAEIEMPRAINLVVIPFGSLLLGLQFLRRAWVSLYDPAPGVTTVMRQD